MPSRLLAATLAAAHPATPPPPLPCTTVDVAQAEVEAAFTKAVRPVAPPRAHEPRRWSVLMPVRVWLGGHDGVRAGLAWTETQSGLDGRWTQYADRALTFRVEWDLRDLTHDPLPPPPPTTAQHIEVALKAEQLADKLAEPLRQLKRAQAAARVLVVGDPLCGQVQADALAAAFVLRAVIGASQSGVTGPPTGSADPGPAAPRARPPASPE